MSRGVALRAQLNRQVAHWRAAVVTIDDADNFASAEAWTRVERLSRISRCASSSRARSSGCVRGERAGGATRRRRRRLEQLAAGARAACSRSGGCYVAGRDDARLLRRRGQHAHQSEARVDPARPRPARAARAWSRCCDRSGVDTPPVLTYIDKGLGASILRAGSRLWDGGTISPAAAIKITRHNLYRPTAPDPRDRASGRAHPRLDRGVRRGACASSCAAPRARARSLRAGWTRPRWWPTSTPSCIAATARSPRCTTSSRPRRTPCSATSRAIPTRSRTSACCSTWSICRRMFGAGPWDELGDRLARGPSASSARPPAHARFLEQLR